MPTNYVWITEEPADIVVFEDYHTFRRNFENSIRMTYSGGAEVEIEFRYDERTATAIIKHQGLRHEIVARKVPVIDEPTHL